MNIKNVDITCGDRCGVMNPVPYIEYNETVEENKQVENNQENDNALQSFSGEIVGNLIGYNKQQFKNKVQSSKNNLDKKEIAYITNIFDKDYLNNQINDFVYYKYSNDIYEIIKDQHFC